MNVVRYLTALATVIISFSLQLLAAERIVSFAPGITDIVISLGKGNELVGITDYCIVPDEYKKIPRVGGFLDANYERLITLKPTIVLLYEENVKLKEFLESRFIRIVAVRHATLSDIYTSINDIGFALNVSDKAAELNQTMHKKLLEIAMRHPGYTNRKNVMIVVGRDKGTLQNMYIVGKGDFLEELLSIMNAENAYEGQIQYPKVSAESVMHMNPDVIIEFLQDMVRTHGKDAVKKDWQQYARIPAVKNGRVYEADPDYALFPSPRIVDIALMLERFIYD